MVLSQFFHGIGVERNAGQPTYVYPAEVKRLLRSVFSQNICDYADPCHEKVSVPPTYRRTAAACGQWKPVRSGTKEWGQVRGRESGTVTRLPTLPEALLLGQGTAWLGPLWSLELRVKLQEGGAVLSLAPCLQDFPGNVPSVGAWRLWLPLAALLSSS